MLVLSRKKGESIVVRDDIIVTVVDLRNGKVRLGIEAPREVAVHRTEVYDKINSRKEIPSAA
jgi:carbon storage regulator